MDEFGDDYRGWPSVGEEERERDFRSYAYRIAEARYVMRRITRILNDQAKQHGFDPLLHQALLQIYGTTPDAPLAINGLAERLDIPAAFASRLVSKLETRDLARREASTTDRRVTNVTITEAGVTELRDIDAGVHHHVAYFQRQLDGEQRLAALSIFAFYVGYDSPASLARALRESN